MDTLGARLIIAEGSISLNRDMYSWLIEANMSMHAVSSSWAPRGMKTPMRTLWRDSAPLLGSDPDVIVLAVESGY